MRNRLFCLTEQTDRSKIIELIGGEEIYRTILARHGITDDEDIHQLNKRIRNWGWNEGFSLLLEGASLSISCQAAATPVDRAFRALVHKALFNWMIEAEPTGRTAQLKRSFTEPSQN